MCLISCSSYTKAASDTCQTNFAAAPPLVQWARLTALRSRCWPKKSPLSQNQSGKLASISLPRKVMCAHGPDTAFDQISVTNFAEAATDDGDGSRRRVVPRLLAPYHPSLTLFLPMGTTVSGLHLHPAYYTNLSRNPHTSSTSTLCPLSPSLSLLLSLSSALIRFGK